MSNSCKLVYGLMWLLVLRKKRRPNFLFIFIISCEHTIIISKFEQCSFHLLPSSILMLSYPHCISSLVKSVTHGNWKRPIGADSFEGCSWQWPWPKGVECRMKRWKEGKECWYKWNEGPCEAGLAPSIEELRLTSVISWKFTRSNSNELQWILSQFGSYLATKSLF